MSTVTLAPMPVAERVTAAQIIDRLENRSQDLQDPDARRRHARRLWGIHVTVSIVEGDGCASDTDETITYDLSPGGIGFVCIRIVFLLRFKNLN